MVNLSENVQIAQEEEFVEAVPNTRALETNLFGSEIHSRHPFFIKPCEHSGTKITSTTLTGISNFYQWKRGITVALSTRNKLGFVLGTIEPPDIGSVLWYDYNCCKETVAAWIHNSLSEEISKTVLYISEPKKLWETLITRFTEKNATRKFQLKNDLYYSKQGAMNVSEYFAKQKEVRDALKNMTGTSKCDFGAHPALLLLSLLCLHQAIRLRLR